MGAALKRAPSGLRREGPRPQVDGSSVFQLPRPVLAFVQPLLTMCLLGVHLVLSLGDVTERRSLLAW